MQNPLKTNKAFQAAYSTIHDSSKKYVTPQNIDDLILKLNQVKIENSSVKMEKTSSRSCSQQEYGRSLFSDTFIQTLPSSLEHCDEKPSAAGDTCEQQRLWSGDNNQRSLSQDQCGLGKRYNRLAPLDKRNLVQKSSLVQPSLIPPGAKMKYVTRMGLGPLPLLEPISSSHPYSTADTTLSTATLKGYQKLMPTAGRRQNGLQTISNLSAEGNFHADHKHYDQIDQQLESSTTDHSLQDQCVNGETDLEISDCSDNERDSGWTDSDQWCQEEEEEDVLSDIEDDDVSSGSILTDTSGMGTGMEGMESNETWEEHNGTMFSAGVHNDLGTAVYRARSVSTLVVPPRTVYIGERGGDQATPPLTPSLFHGRPPTIHFPLANEKYESLSKEQRSLLKWRMSSITPNVVRHTIARVGFTSTKGCKWMGYWGKHMRSEAFREITESQKINHFPGSFNLGRKDRLWRNLFRLQARHGKKEFDFIPETFVLPSDMRNLKRLWEEGGSRNKWIIKPPASARGIGIKVVNRWSQIPKRKPIIVQRYISDPFLINGSKFDLRIYVYVTSFDPLIIYIYRDGLVRFATTKYSKSSKKLSNRFMHLTNYSVNKRSSQFISNSDETQCFGHKWGLLALWRYMDQNMSIDPGPIWEKIKDLVIKTILSCEGYIVSLVKANVRHSSSVHELFGFDIMLDKHLKPWLLEVNVSPSLHSNSRLDLNIKGFMMRDVFNLCGFKLPTQDNDRLSRCYQSSGLSTEEKIKHSRFTHSKMSYQTDPGTILDHLTRDDCNVIMNIEDEFSRRGGFIRIYPHPNIHPVYAKYFQVQRYYNILVDQWLTKYSKTPHLGITALLKK